MISLQGVQPVSPMQLQPTSIEQLDKALHGNDVWAMAVVDPSSGNAVSKSGSHPEDLAAVLTRIPRCVRNSNWPASTQSV